MYRTVTRDTHVLGYIIPAGTTAAAHGLVSHYLEANWGPDAADSNLKSWLKPGQEQSGGAASKHDMIAFSAGPRNCPGAAYARQKLLTVVARLLASSKLELKSPDFEPQFR